MQEIDFSFYEEPPEQSKTDAPTKMQNKTVHNPVLEDAQGLRELWTQVADNQIEASLMTAYTNKSLRENELPKPPCRLNPASTHLHYVLPKLD